MRACWLKWVGRDWSISADYIWLNYSGANSLVQARGDGAHLVLREPGDAYLLGYPLHLAGARAGGVHLGDGGNEGAVHAPVALDHVVREEAAGAELRDAQRQRAGAGASDLSR